MDPNRAAKHLKASSTVRAVDAPSRALFRQVLLPSFVNRLFGRHVQRLRARHVRGRAVHVQARVLGGGLQVPVPRGRVRRERGVQPSSGYMPVLRGSYWRGMHSSRRCQRGLCQRLFWTWNVRGWGLRVRARVERCLLRDRRMHVFGARDLRARKAVHVQGGVGRGVVRGGVEARSQPSHLSRRLQRKRCVRRCYRGV